MKLATLRERARLLTEVRAFFVGRGSLEVETPAVVLSPGVDAHLDAPAVSLGSEFGFLTTSPEYHMKRLLAAGSGPIHQLGKAWRAGERGRLHEPEFTMLEWYVPGADDHALMDETEDLVRAVSRALRAPLRHGPHTCNPAPAFRRRTVREAFLQLAGVDPDVEEAGRLGRLLRAGGHKPPSGCDREELLDLVLALVVQPQLGLDVPEFLTGWPPDRAALARLRTDSDGREVAARFELYACGVELCNGYHELNDAPEQRRRIDAENRRRVALGKEPQPVDEAFVQAVGSLPDCAGNALGIDRLLMLLVGAEDIGEVRAFRVEL